MLLGVLAILAGAGRLVPPSARATSCAPEAELCDRLDNDCDGAIDEARADGSPSCAVGDACLDEDLAGVWVSRAGGFYCLPLVQVSAR